MCEHLRLDPERALPVLSDSSSMQFAGFGVCPRCHDGFSSLLRHASASRFRHRLAHCVCCETHWTPDFGGCLRRLLFVARRQVPRPSWQSLFAVSDHPCSARVLIGPVTHVVVAFLRRHGIDSHSCFCLARAGFTPRSVALPLPFIVFVRVNAWFDDLFGFGFGCLVLRFWCDWLACCERPHLALESWVRHDILDRHRCIWIASCIRFRHPERLAFDVAAATCGTALPRAWFG